MDKIGSTTSRYNNGGILRFNHYDLGHRKMGEIVEITLSGNAANVRLLDSSNFNSYRNGRQHRCIGGLARSLAGKPLAGFRATPSRRIPV